MKKYSVIVPLFNRPNEIDELLQSLVEQTYKDFEVIIVEDGSTDKADLICNQYSTQLDLKYFYKENQGPGEARNYGCRKASSDFFIFFDSDCLIPKDYFFNLSKAQQNQKFDFYGGPDAASITFTPVQKAINYSMTSIFTTGGIRGAKSSVEKFHPRSFNMGITREVFEKTNGFSAMRYGEDIDFSIRITKAGFKSALLRECFVFHKRRTNFHNFFKQVYHSGAARIVLYQKHPKSLKLLHFFPMAFTLYLFVSIAASLILNSLIPLIPVLGYLLIIFIHSLALTRSLNVSFLSITASVIQLTGYGIGFLNKAINHIIK